ncbi:MAG TPA: ribosome maturation factor RimM [Porticoccaceae bacterium]|nr:ribosome maturation factor RimM [Porticoccaceae bacterium]
MTRRPAESVPERAIRVGRIATVHGVRGWLKIESGTEPAANILGYCPWWLARDGRWEKVEPDAGEVSGKRILAHLAGVDDRDAARGFCQLDIHVDAALLPALPKDEYYWHQLIGLRVMARTEAQPVALGSVTSLLETGANDVLVVHGDETAVDCRERLIPYTAVLVVDLERGTIEVDWAPEY